MEAFEAGDRVFHQTIRQHIEIRICGHIFERKNSDQGPPRLTDTIPHRGWSPRRRHIGTDRFIQLTGRRVGPDIQFLLKYIDADLILAYRRGAVATVV